LIGRSITYRLPSARVRAIDRSHLLANDRALLLAVVIDDTPEPMARVPGRMADLLVLRLGGGRFSWGSATLQDAGDLCARYIAALQAADRHDIAPLLHSRARSGQMF